MSAQDKAILTLVKEHPTLSMYEIGKLLQQQGTSKSNMSVYSNLRYSQYLSLEIDKIHTHNVETLARKGVPRANKTLINIIKDRSIADVDKLPAINTVLKYGTPKEHTPSHVTEVSIDKVTFIQQIVKENVAADDEVVEGEVVDE